MKMRYMTLGLLALMAAGCSNEALEDASAIHPANGEVQIAATISQGGSTRVGFTAEGNVVHAGWEEKDTITLYTDEQNRLYYVASINENGETVFTPTDETLANTEGGTVYACYPATKMTDYSYIYVSGNRWLYQGEQEYGAYRVKRSTCPFLYAKGVIKDGVVNLEFKHLFAYLKLEIKAEALEEMTNKVIQAITLSVNGDEPLCASGSSFNLGNQSHSIGYDEQEMTIRCTHDFTTGDLELYVPVLPMKTGSTMTIRLQQTDDSGNVSTTLYTMRKNLPSSGFIAGNVYSLTLGKQEAAETAYLVDGPTFNTRIKSLAGNSYWAENDENITKIEFKTEFNEAVTGENVEVSADNSEGIIYASFNESDGVVTVYTSAKTIEMTDASKLFFGLRALKTIDWGNIKVNENTTNTSGMFSGCSALDITDLSHWDTSNVTDMSSMFYGCSNIYTLSLATWDVSKVTNMSYMFYGCTELDTPDVSQWNTSNVTDMSGMFSDCSFMLSLPLATWDVSNVTNMNCMFDGCTNLKQPNLSNWNTSNVTDMGGMFSGCQYLTSLDLSQWDVSNVIYMYDLFRDCTKLKQANIANWNTSNVTNMNSMFSGCASMISPEVSAWNVSNVTNMESMFDGCGYTSLDLSAWNVSKVTNMSYMFRGDDYEFETTASLNLAGWDISNVENPCEIFSSNRIQSLNVSNWNTSNLTSMTEMFYHCENLTSLDLSTWDVSNVTNMYGLFDGCYCLQSLDVSTWNVSKVKDMVRMFKSCPIQSLDISTWNVSRVTSMYEMFYGCSMLTSLDLSAWNVSRTTSMGRMFAYCNSLSALNISGWSLHENVECGEMFYRSEWDSSVHCTITATQATQETLMSKCTIDDTFSWVIVE